MRRVSLALALLLGPGPTFAVDGPVLTGDTSRPEVSLFAPGEPVRLTFSAEGLTDAPVDLALGLDITDEMGRSVKQLSLPVAPGPDGTWQATADAPADRLGFYRVRAELSNGVQLAALGSRPPGFLTYAVVPDPAQRKLHPSRETFFGMQPSGTISNAPKVEVGPWLGIRWVLGGYQWGWYEPDRPGQAADTIRQRRAEAGPPADWVTYPISPLFKAPKWAVRPETLIYETGTLTPQGEAAWRDYCRVAAKAAMEDRPDLDERVYQITWEPYYPWGFRGTDEDLIRIYEIAYPVLHEVDPKAVVIGPTGAGIGTSGDVEWNSRLLSKGLARYIDAFCIHPYHAIPPERLGMLEHVRALKEAVRQAAGREIDLFGTEQGAATGGDPAKELDQARGLARENLIMLGEGFRANLQFYVYDYSTEAGYGFFYNLTPGTPWGPNKLAPKPVAAQFAAQSFILEGHKSAGAIEWLGDTALGYAYERGEHVVLALWDYGDAPRTVSLDVGVPEVTVWDWMGNGRSAAAPDGSLGLSLGPEPIYIEGVSPALWGSSAAKPVQLTTGRLAGYPGAHVLVRGSAGISEGPARRATLRCELDPRLEAPAAEQPVSLTADQRTEFEFDIVVPADAEPGTYPVRVSLADEGRQLGLAGTVLNVAPPVAIGSVHPVLDANGRPAVEVDVHNETDEPQDGRVELRWAGIPDTEQALPLSVAAGADASLTFAYPSLDVLATKRTTADIAIALGGGYRFSQRRPVNFVLAARVESPEQAADFVAEQRFPRAIVLGGREMLVRAPKQYHGRRDLGATLTLSWDDRCLYVDTRVVDDVHLQPNTGYDTWKGDCVQLAFDLDPGKQQASTGNQFADLGGKHRASEIDLALTPEGTQAFRTITFDAERLPVRLLTNDELALDANADRREGSGSIGYFASIPWATLGLAEAPRVGDRIGLAVAINDMDDPAEQEPKALGLFGGITPTKDPAQFGCALLVGSDSPSRRVPTALRPVFSGVLGQNELATVEPVPFIGTAGAAVDAEGRPFTIAGDTLYGFTMTQAGNWSRSSRQKLPAPPGSLVPCFDGERLFYAGANGRVYAVALGAGEAEQVGGVAPGEKVRGIAVALAGLNAGFAARARLFVLDGDTVSAHAADGTPAGPVLSLSRPAGASWWYCALGVEPTTGDLLVGSCWPDSKVYRFAATGEEVTRDGWPRAGHARVLTALGDVAWMVDEGGTASPLPLVQGRDAAGPSFGGLGSMYPSGLARDKGGAFWLASSQGLVRFDRRGRPEGKRIGGIDGVRSLGIATDGTVIAAVEGGQRMLRLALDDEADAPLACNANEPWRTGNGWTGRAAGLAWDAGTFLAADEVGKQLWGFDPWHTGFQETPWPKVTEPGTFAEPRAVAVGDTRAWVLDGGRIVELDRQTLATRDVTEPRLPDLTTAVALAAGLRELLFVAFPDRVVALSGPPDGTYVVEWEATGLRGVAGIAVAGKTVVVSERDGRCVSVFDGQNGTSGTALGTADVPGGMLPGPIAASGRWIVVADEQGKRLIRLCLPH